MRGRLASRTDGVWPGINRARASVKTNILVVNYDVMSGITAYGTKNLEDALHRTVTFNNFAQATFKRQLGQGNTQVSGDLRS